MNIRVILLLLVIQVKEVEVCSGLSTHFTYLPVSLRNDSPRQTASNSSHLTNNTTEARNSSHLTNNTTEASNSSDITNRSTEASNSSDITNRSTEVNNSSDIANRTAEFNNSSDITNCSTAVNSSSDIKYPTAEVSNSSDITNCSTAINNSSDVFDHTTAVSNSSDVFYHTTEVNNSSDITNCSTEVGNASDSNSSCTLTNQTAEDVLLRGFCREQRENHKQCAIVDCFPCLQHHHHHNDNCSMGTCCLQELTEATRTAGKYTGCTEDQVVAVVRCPDHWPTDDDDVRWACEQRAGKFTKDEPVSDPGSAVTFRNKDCAACHGVRMFVPWTRSVACDHFQFVYTAESTEELLQKASRHSATCKVGSAAPTDKVPVQRCPSDLEKWYRADVVRSCNATGRWERLDQSLADDCARYEALSLRVHDRSSNMTFQNWFCAQCNGVATEHGPCLLSRDKQPERSEVFTSPLTLLLGLQNHPEPLEPPDNPANCSQGRWKDLQGRCRDVTCTEGKVIRAENYTCSTAVPMIRGLAYDLHIVLTAKNVSSLPDTQQARAIFKECLGDTLKAKLNLSDYGEVRVSTRFTVDGEGMIIIQDMVLKGWVVSSRNTPRDELEALWVENMLRDWDIVGEDNDSMTFAFAYTGHGLQELLAGHAEPDSVLTFHTHWDLEPEIRNFLWNFPCQLSIPLTPVLACPAVSFPASDFEVVRSQGTGRRVEVRLKFGGFSTPLLDLSRVEVKNRTLRVCLSVLEELSGQSGPAGLLQGSPFWEYALSMTVIPLSIVCLGVTLAVYAALPPLRTLPGLNLMGTCGSLLLAQLSLLVVVHRPVQGFWCTALGILVHVFWLSTFCWTFVSSLHMFRTFSSSTTTTSSAKKGRGVLTHWLKNFGVTMVVPAVVVVVVVAASWASSDGESVGYSGTRCYLASPWLVGMGLVLPLTLIVLVNVTLFALTARRIQQVVSLRARAESKEDSGHHRHLHACFRLSLLTGATWLLSFLAEGLGLPWLRVASVLVNGGQGALLLLSCVTTRRVAAMLAGKLGCKTPGRKGGRRRSRAGSATVSVVVGSTKRGACVSQHTSCTDTGGAVSDKGGSFIAAEPLT